MDLATAVLQLCLIAISSVCCCRAAAWVLDAKGIGAGAGAKRVVEKLPPAAPARPDLRFSPGNGATAGLTAVVLVAADRRALGARIAAVVADHQSRGTPGSGALRCPVRYDVVDASPLGRRWQVLLRRAFSTEVLTEEQLGAALPPGQRTAGTALAVLAMDRAASRASCARYPGALPAGKAAVPLLSLWALHHIGDGDARRRPIPADALA